MFLIIALFLSRIKWCYYRDSRLAVIGLSFTHTEWILKYAIRSIWKPYLFIVGLEPHPDRSKPIWIFGGSRFCIAIEIARFEKKYSNINDVRWQLIELFAFQCARNDPCKAAPFIFVDEPSSNSCLFAYPLNVCKRWHEYISRKPHADHRTAREALHCTR